MTLMLVITATRQDLVAQALASLWAAHDAAVLTSADLAMSGWRDYLNTNEGSTAVVSGQIVAVEEITGVLTLLPGVFEEELGAIVPEDRVYVATEMTAFLFSWLSRLKCPVLNRPTPTCLSGPYWRPEQWINAAAQVGIPVHRLHRQAVLSGATQLELSERQSTNVTVVGTQCFGAVDVTLAVQARRLADLAQVDLLEVQFSSSEPGANFISVNLWPDITANEVANAILAYLQGVQAGDYHRYR
jgi:hypothetical protein